MARKARRTRFGPPGESRYDPRFTPTVAEKIARELFFERLTEIAPAVGESLHADCLDLFRSADPPDKYCELWDRGWLSVEDDRTSVWTGQLAQRAESVRAAQREKVRRYAGLRRALLAWRRRWNLHERKPMRDPWALDAALWTLRLVVDGLLIPVGRLRQPLGRTLGPQRIIGKPLPFELNGWDLVRGESETNFRQRVKAELEAYCAARSEGAGFVKIESANTAARDFDLLIRHRVLGTPMKDLLHSDDLPDAIDRRAANMAIRRAANRVGLK